MVEDAIKIKLDSLASTIGATKQWLFGIAASLIIATACFAGGVVLKVVRVETIVVERSIVTNGAIDRLTEQVNALTRAVAAQRDSLDARVRAVESRLDRLEVGVSVVRP